MDLLEVNELGFAVNVLLCLSIILSQTHTPLYKYVRVASCVPARPTQKAVVCFWRWLTAVWLLLVVRGGVSLTNIHVPGESMYW